MLTQDKRSEDSRVHGPAGPLGRAVGRYLNVRLDRAPNRMYRRADPQSFHSAWVPTSTRRRLAKLSPQIAHLHWVCNGFLRIEDVAHLGMPVVWTFHDMWPMTGGCHYAGGCRAFERHCGRCPKLGSRFSWDLSRLAWLRKHRSLSAIDITVVAPSHWLAGEARRSSVFRDARIEVIPGCVDLRVYRPRPRAALRAELGIPNDAPLLLFGAVAATQDHRKGFDLLRAAMQPLRGRLPEATRLVVFGSDRSGDHEEFGFRIHYAGSIADDEQLARHYAAADLFVSPAREDNLPNTVVEALACGTPVVAFDVGGLPDLVDPGKTGFLARPCEPQSLADAIVRALDPGLAATLSSAARARAERDFGTCLHAERLVSLYHSILADNATAAPGARYHSSG